MTSPKQSMTRPTQISVPGGGYVSVSEQTIGGQPTGRFTAMLVLGGSVVHSAEGPSASKAVASVGTWLHGLNASVADIAMKLRHQKDAAAKGIFDGDPYEGPMNKKGDW